MHKNTFLFLRSVGAVFLFTLTMISVPDSVKSWLKDLGNPYSDVLIDKNGKIAIDWGVYGIPETFIINSKGIIKYRHAGPITKKIYKKIYALIEETN